MNDDLDLEGNEEKELELKYILPLTLNMYIFCHLKFCTAQAMKKEMADSCRTVITDYFVTCVV